MNSLNTVQLVGKVTLPPKIRSLKNGSKVAEIGMGISESFKNDKDEWSSRLHFVDIVLWDKQATYAEQKLSKGDGLIVQGSLQFDQWEAKDGSKRSKLLVRGHRVQVIAFPPSTASA